MSKQRLVTLYNQLINTQSHTAKQAVIQKYENIFRAVNTAEKYQTLFKHLSSITS